jgi:hypothetical protein
MSSSLHCETLKTTMAQKWTQAARFTQPVDPVKSSRWYKLIVQNMYWLASKHGEIVICNMSLHTNTQLISINLVAAKCCKAYHAQQE